MTKMITEFMIQNQAFFISTLLHTNQTCFFFHCLICCNNCNCTVTKPKRKSIPATTLFDSDSSDDDLFSSKHTRKPHRPAGKEGGFSLYLNLYGVCIHLFHSFMEYMYTCNITLQNTYMYTCNIASQSVDTLVT